MTAPVTLKADDRNVERAIARVRAIESGQTGDALVDGELRPGAVLKARVARFMEFRDGRIRRQRDYCCYEPIGG